MKVYHLRRNICLKIFLGVLPDAKSTMHAWHFCIRHPSSILLGIHFYNFRDKGVRIRLEYITIFYKRNSPKNLYVKNFLQKNA